MSFTHKPVASRAFRWKADGNRHVPGNTKEGSLASASSSSIFGGTKSASNSPRHNEFERDSDRKCSSNPRASSPSSKLHPGFEFSFQPVVKQQEETDAKNELDPEKVSTQNIPEKVCGDSTEKRDAIPKQEVTDGVNYTTTDYRYIVQYLLDNLHSPKLNADGVLEIRSLLTLYRLRNELFSSETTHLQSRLRFYFVLLQYNLQVAIADLKEQEMKNVGIVLSDASLREMSHTYTEQRTT